MISDHQPVATVTTISFWLVVSTHLKNISQLGFFPIYGKIKNVPNHQSGVVGCHFTLPFPGFPGVAINSSATTGIHWVLLLHGRQVLVQSLKTGGNHRF
jgi:hypothetical protein